MVSLNSLPPVALACIAKHLDSAIDTNALVQTCTRLCHILDPFLYQYDCQQDSPAALVWAASQRDSAAVAAATARKALVACRDPALCGRRRRNHDDDDDTAQIKKALFAAVVYNNVGIAQLLLGGTEEVDGGVDPNARSNDPPRDTLLIRAGGLGHAEIVDFLLSLPVDVNARDASGRSALLRAVEGATAAHRGPHVAVVRKLLAYPGEDLNAQDADGFTALASLARLGHAELAEEMLQTGKVSYSGGVNSSNSTTTTPLFLAAVGGHEQVVDVLLRYCRPEIDIDAVDEDGRTALSMAAWCGHHGVVRKLLLVEGGGGGANVDTRDYMGQTPLSRAAEEGYEEVVKVLLAVKEDDTAALADYCNSTDKIGRTALSYAAENGYVDVVKLLLEAGADLDIACDAGRRPVDWAERYGNEILAEVIRNWG